MSQTSIENRILYEWNNTTKEYSSDISLYDLISKSFGKNPDGIAIIFKDENITYRELENSVNRISNQLLSAGINKGQRIGIYLRRDPQLIIYLLAMLKIGAVYVPINLFDPVHRINRIIEQADLHAILVNFNMSLEGINFDNFIDIDEFSKNTTISGQPFLSKISPEDPAYIIYTSGSTGDPKGVYVNNTSVVNLIEWVNKTFKVGKYDTLLWTTNLSFDLSVYDIFGILAARGTIFLLDDEERADPQYQASLLVEGRITFWDSAPQALEQVVPFLSAKDIKKTHDNLRLVFLSGDWIPLNLPDIIRNTFNKAEIVGLGGATEATVWSNYFIIKEVDPAWKSIPYGKPIQNSRYYILNKNLKHSGVLSPGDLYIGGKCLAMGYYNDPELTRSKFISDPFNTGERLYFTGDKAKWLPDGNIEFLGREDDQVKIRGYRVELGEIKSFIQKVEDVDDVVLIADKSDKYDPGIIAFLKISSGKNFKLEALKESMRNFLPDYMIPLHFYLYDEFPITANGKVNRKRLFDDYLEDIHENLIEGLNSNEHIFESDNQKRVHAIYEEIIGKKITDFGNDIQNLGGNSIHVIQIITRLKALFATDISIQVFYANSSINGICKLLGSRIQVESKREENHLEYGDIIPMSSFQLRLWVLLKINKDNPAYNIPFLNSFEGDLNIKVFQKSIDQVFKRHRLLSSVFFEEEDGYYCEIRPFSYKIEFLDYQNIPQSDFQRKLHAFIDQDSQIPYDLENGPMFRLFLIREEKKKYWFYCNFHHLIFDGWSWKLFADELGQAYNFLLKGDEVNSQKIDYSDYILKLKEKNDNHRYSDLLVFWSDYLNGSLDDMQLPNDFFRPKYPTGKGGKIPLIISKEKAGQLAVIYNSQGISPYVTYLALFGLLLNKYTGENDFNIGIPVSARDNRLSEEYITMLVNTIVVRLNINGNHSFFEYLKTVNDSFLQAFNNRELPFEKIVECTKPRRRLNVNPLFQVSVVWLNQMADPPFFKKIKSERHSVLHSVSPFDITVFLWEKEGEILGEIEYNSDIFQRDTISQIKDRFINLIDNFLADNKKEIHNYSIISKKEFDKLNAFNETARPYPSEKSIIELFEEVVKLHPEQTAISYKGNAYTYKELNEKANCLAWNLMELGIKKESRVGVLVEKSNELIIGILGILKSGAAYIPIDPDYPVDRINYMLKDTNSQVLLVSHKTRKIKTAAKFTINLSDEKLYNRSFGNPDNKISSRNLAYIMYTSGTTGNPKGSMIEHRSVVRLVRNTNYIDYKSTDRILLTGAIVFDATTFEIWGALLNGGSLFITDRENILKASTLKTELHSNNINILWLTSALFTNIAESDPKVFSGLDFLLTGGDVLSPSHINMVRAANPGLKVINGYGPTENTTFSTCYLIEEDFEQNIPIGKLISNSRAYILDKNLNYLPIGAVGELFLAGDGLSRGYVNNENLNRNKFLVHPGNKNERLYRTGDLARWLPDGTLEFHGRVDNQIKVRGYRVEIEGVEAAINGLDEVVESVVKAIRYKPGDMRLVAIIKPQLMKDDNEKRISMKLRRTLPDYMIPSKYLFVDDIPRGVNGKIDRDAVKIDTAVLYENKKEIVIPSSKIEKVLVEIWENVLNVQINDVKTSFFDLGGNSLLAIPVIEKAEKIFKVEILLRVFFESPTIEDLANYIDCLILEKSVIKNNKNPDGINYVNGEI